jgi:hypothetical protein
MILMYLVLLIMSEYLAFWWGSTSHLLTKLYQLSFSFMRVILVDIPVRLVNA